MTAMDIFIDFKFGVGISVKAENDWRGVYPMHIVYANFTSAANIDSDTFNSVVIYLITNLYIWNLYFTVELV